MHRRLLLAAPALLAVPARAQGQVIETGRGPFRLTVLAEGLERPWGGGFLPDGRLLVSERPGRARLIAPDGRVSAPLAGVPAVEPGGQGGLLDLQPAPDFARTQEVFFAASMLVQGGALTRLWRARLTAAGLADAAPVLDCTPAQSSGRLHYGGRLAFSPDGAHLFLTSGDRNVERARAQRLDDLAGKIIRLTRSGHVPADNPFAGRAGARGEIWSYGHRNPQGIAFHPVTGSLLAAEFGPRGGDELNLIQPGRNYGWPEVTHGREYWGGSIAGGRTAGPGFDAPLRQWTPSVSPSGIGVAPPRGPWRGDLFLACLNPAGLLRVEMVGDQPGAEERLLWGQARLRQVLFAPDGALLALTDEAAGRVLRLAPA
ncbi:MAG: PQQ-dependent sugar dehydrogenase [Rubritepida sp.]|jgi:glucose/arabinose dehydrogenase|nr:PQQ-dependent sugar dehydrogenase [Rubritepida sp.]